MGQIYSSMTPCMSLLRPTTSCMYEHKHFYQETSSIPPALTRQKYQYNQMHLANIFFLPKKIIITKNMLHKCPIAPLPTAMTKNEPHSIATFSITLLPSHQRVCNSWTNNYKLNTYCKNKMILLNNLKTKREEKKNKWIMIRWQTETRIREIRKKLLLWRTELHNFRQTHIVLKLLWTKV